MERGGERWRGMERGGEGMERDERDAREERMMACFHCE